MPAVPAGAGVERRASPDRLRNPNPAPRAPARRRASSSSSGPTTLSRPPSSRPSHQPPRPTDADDPPATALQLPPPDHELKVAALMGRGHRATSTKSRRARFPPAAGSRLRATLAAYRAEFHDQGRVPSSASTAVAAAGEPSPAGERTARVLASYRRTAADRGRGQAQAFWPPSSPPATGPRGSRFPNILRRVAFFRTRRILATSVGAVNPGPIRRTRTRVHRGGAVGGSAPARVLEAGGRGQCIVSPSSPSSRSASSASASTMPT